MDFCVGIRAQNFIIRWIHGRVNTVKGLDNNM